MKCLPQHSLLSNIHTSHPFPTFSISHIDEKHKLSREDTCHEAPPHKKISLPCGCNRIHEWRHGIADIGNIGPIGCLLAPGSRQNYHKPYLGHAVTKITLNHTRPTQSLKTTIYTWAKTSINHTWSHSDLASPCTCIRGSCNMALRAMQKRACGLRRCLRPGSR